MKNQLKRFAQFKKKVNDICFRMVLHEKNVKLLEMSSHLAKISLSSCSDTNCPKLATNKVEHGAFAANGGFGCCDAPLEPTGLALIIVKRKHRNQFWCYGLRKEQ